MRFRGRGRRGAEEAAATEAEEAVEPLRLTYKGARVRSELAPQAESFMREVVGTQLGATDHSGDSTMLPGPHRVIINAPVKRTVEVWELADGTVILRPKVPTA